MSPCVVSLLLVPRKDGTWRMCDNSPTVSYHHRLDDGIACRNNFSHKSCNFKLKITHRLNDMLDDLHESYVFCKLDYKINCRIYKRLVESFGLTNLSNIFRGLNNRLLCAFLGKLLLLYDNLIYCKCRCMRVKLRGYMLRDDILVCWKKLIKRDRQLGCLVGDLRHECLYFNPEILDCFGSNLGNVLKTSSISSTSYTASFDLVTGFNSLTLIDSITLTIGVSGNLGKKQEFVLEASQTCKRKQSRRVVFDPCDGGWVYI